MLWLNNYYCQSKLLAIAPYFEIISKNMYMYVLLKKDIDLEYYWRQLKQLAIAQWARTINFSTTKTIENQT